MPPVLQLLLQNKLTVGALRAMTPLPEDAQRMIDNQVVEVGLDRLVVVQDLLAEGLTFPVANALSVMELQWDRVTRSGFAQRTMSPSARGENQLPDRDPARIPLYCTTDDFNLGIRTLAASRRVGAPLDVTMVASATRNVNEAIEDAAINGVDFNVNGNTAPGLLTAPGANTYQYTGGEAWDAAGKTGEEILADVQGMIALSHAARRFGPFNLYIPTNYGIKLDSDFKANSDLSIRKRLEMVESGGRGLRIRVADQLPAHRTVLVQMTKDVIDVVTGQSPVTIPWTSPDGFTLNWLVMAIMVTRVKDDYDGNSGITLGYTS